MFKILIRIFYTTGIESIRNTDGRCISERYSCVKLIITFQKAFRNDVEKLPAMFFPVVRCQLSCNTIKLRIQTVSLRRNAKSLFQGCLHRWNIFVFHLPEINRPRAFSCSRIRNIEHITQPRIITAVIQQSNTFRAALYIAVHSVIPKVILSTGCGIRTLCMDQQLVGIRILIKATGCCQKRLPSVRTFCNHTSGVFSQCCIIRCLGCHLIPPILICRLFKEIQLLKFCVIHFLQLLQQALG